MDLPSVRLAPSNGNGPPNEVPTHRLPEERVVTAPQQTTTVSFPRSVHSHEKPKETHKANAFGGACETFLNGLMVLFALLVIIYSATLKRK